MLAPQKASSVTLQGLLGSAMPVSLPGTRYALLGVAVKQSLVPTPSDPYHTRMPLKRQLGLWSAVAVLIGSTIGSGIFRTPAGIAAKLPGPLPLMSVWVA